MIKQIRVSRNVKFFKDKMMQKYGLNDYSDANAPVVMFGAYNTDDYNFFENHKPFIILLWCGTDAKILNPVNAARIKAKKNCHHIAGSKSVFQSLAKNGINADIIPITPTPIDIDMAPSGNSVYCYICSDNPLMSNKYHFDWLKILEKKLPYKFIFKTQRKDSRDRLKDIYRNCFVGVRLLDHDGMSNSIIEMGMMGRRTISNSLLPHTIPWKNINDIQASIVREYNKRNTDNKIISEDYRKLIDIGNKWLEEA